MHPETDYFLNSSTKSSAASSASEFQGDFQPLDIPYFEDHLATVQNTWTLSPHQGGQPSVQETEYFNSNSTGLEGVDPPLNTLEEHLATAQDIWTLSANQGVQPSVQLPNAYYVVSEDSGVYNVVQSSETATAAPGPRHEETRSLDKVETPVQRCRRIKRENQSALLEEERCLDVDLAEGMKKMLEFKGEINILSRLTMAGDDIAQMVQSWINKEDEAKR